MKRFFRILFYSATGLLAMLYGAASLSAYINPAKFPLFGLLGLAFPPLLVLLVSCLISSVFVNRRWALLLLVCIFAGYRTIFSVLAFNSGKPSVQAKAPGTVRILGWNVRGLDTKQLIYDSANSIRRRMLNYIRETGPDIAFFQEFVECEGPSYPSNLQFLRDSLHFPYVYFRPDYQDNTPWVIASSGLAIVSKYPLENIRYEAYKGKRKPESIVMADLTLIGRTKRLIITHFQSLHLGQTRSANKDILDISEDSSINYSDSKLKKIKYYQAYHARQCEQLKLLMDGSPFPLIFSADLNEVPSSYVYHQLAGNMKDAFLEKGRGFGQTYFEISPTLRIDYLLFSPGTKITQYKKDNIYLSDHYPHCADIEW